MPRKLGWNWGWQCCITVNKALKHFQKRLRQLSLLDGAKNTAWHCNVSYRTINNNVNISTIEKHSVVINLLLHFCACSNKISLLVFYRTKHVQWIHTCLTGPHFVIAPRCFSLIWQPWCNFFQKYVETQDNIALFQQSRESFPRTSPQLRISNMNYKSEEHVSPILTLFLTANWEEISYIFPEILNFLQTY